MRAGPTECPCEKRINQAREVPGRARSKRTGNVGAGKRAPRNAKAMYRRSVTAMPFVTRCVPLLSGTLQQRAEALVLVARFPYAIVQNSDYTKQHRSQSRSSLALFSASGQAESHREKKTPGGSRCKVEGRGRRLMYIQLHGLALLPVPMPQPVRPGPPPVRMPKPLAPPPPIVSPPQILLVRSRVQCTLAQRAAIQNIVGPGTVITDTVIRGAIQSAHDDMFPDLTDPSMPPRQSLVEPRSLLAKERFKASFGRSPDALPWPGARWDLGRIVAARLAGARVTMFSISLRISCFGWPWSGGGTDRPMDYMVKALPNRERVALGALFWRSFAAGDVVSEGAAILIAGMVMRYGLSYRMLAPPLCNVHC